MDPLKDFCSFPVVYLESGPVLCRNYKCQKVGHNLPIEPIMKGKCQMYLKKRKSIADGTPIRRCQEYASKDKYGDRIYCSNHLEFVLDAEKPK